MFSRSPSVKRPVSRWSWQELCSTAHSHDAQHPHTDLLPVGRPGVPGAAGVGGAVGSGPSTPLQFLDIQHVAGRLPQLAGDEVVAVKHVEPGHGEAGQFSLPTRRSQASWKGETGIEAGADFRSRSGLILMEMFCSLFQHGLWQAVHGIPFSLQGARQAFRNSPAWVSIQSTSALWRW